MTHPEDFPGVAICDLSANERALVWCMRTIASMPGCRTRLKLGLASLMPANRAGLAAELSERVLHQIARLSARGLKIGVSCSRTVTWDEAALLALLCASHDDAEAIARWLRRLGVYDPADSLVADLMMLGVLLEDRNGGEARIRMHLAASPRPEPELSNRDRESVHPEHPGAA